MIARAGLSRREVAVGASGKLAFRSGAALFFGFFAISSAGAQVAGSIGLESDYRLRGDSLTNDRPALWGEITYDHPSGAYGSLYGLTAIDSKKFFVGAVADLGYAKRLSRRLTVDVGALRSELAGATRGAEAFRYTEVYAGGYLGPVSGRVYFSPDYRGRNQTLYAELNADAEPAAGWRVSGHLGLLTYLRSSGGDRSADRRKDWRLSLARTLGRFEVHAALVRGDWDKYARYRSRAGATVTIGASARF